MDNATGPGLVVDVVGTQVGQLRALAGSGSQEPIELAAQFIEHAGWLHQDSSRLDQALSCTDESVDLAERAQDPELTAYNLMCKATY